MAQMKHTLQYDWREGGAGVHAVGMDQFLLCLFLFIVHPNAEDDDVAVFILNNGGRLYIVAKQLAAERKSCNTQEKSALWKHTKHCSLEICCELNYFLRDHLVLTKFLDFDETGISLEKFNRKDGLAYLALRVRKNGHYTRGHKVTVIYS
jgi:hypothetical protein